DGVLPMFDPDPAIKDWVIVIRDVTSGVNTADVGLTILVDEYAVVELNAAVSERFDRRLDTDAYDGKVAFEPQASFCDDAAHTSRSLESGDSVLEDHANTVIAMEPGDCLADVLAQNAEEGRLRWVDDDYVQAFMPNRRYDFRADEPHTHDHGTATGNHLRPNAISVLNRTKAVDTVKIDAGNRHASIAPARGDEQYVE